MTGFEKKQVYSFSKKLGATLLDPSGARVKTSSAGEGKKKQTVVGDFFFFSLVLFILSNLTPVLHFIKRSSAACCTTRGRSSGLLMDLRWASNKEELDFT